MTKLEVFIDFKSPYAFIAKDPTIQLAREFSVNIDWYPLTLNIGSYLGTAKKTKGKVVESNRSSNQWLSVKYAYKDARRYAELRGLTLKGTQKIWDTTLPGSAMLWLKQHHSNALESFINITFDRFWKRELDVEDMAVVTAVLKDAGAPGAEFAAWHDQQGQQELEALQERILDEGVYGVPTYRIGGETYFGREHLPRVRWHLEGEQGALPDIANDSVMQS